MPDLEETLRRLSASFADEVIAALREVPIDELMTLAADGRDYQSSRLAPDPVVRSRRPPRVAEPRAPARQAANAVEARPRAEPVEVRLTSSVIDVGERLFADRGSRGATVAQLADALTAQGAHPATAPDVIRVLVEREVIRDAGFRRTTGQGTAPVFVHVTPARSFGLM